MNILLLLAIELAILASINGIPAQAMSQSAALNASASKNGINVAFIKSNKTDVSFLDVEAISMGPGSFTIACRIYTPSASPAAPSAAWAASTATILDVAHKAFVALLTILNLNITWRVQVHAVALHQHIPRRRWPDA